MLVSQVNELCQFNAVNMSERHVFSTCVFFRAWSQNAFCFILESVYKIYIKLMLSRATCMHGVFNLRQGHYFYTRGNKQLWAILY